MLKENKKAKYWSDLRSIFIFKIEKNVGRTVVLLKNMKNMHLLQLI